MKSILSVLLTILSISLLNAQIQKDWSIVHSPYGNPQNNSILAPDQLYLNSEGDLLAGWTYYIFDSAYFTLGLTNYTSSGSFNWENEYHGAVGSDNQLYNIFLDSLNNIYAMGKVNISNSCEDNVIIKYDKFGNKIWHAEDDCVESYGLEALLLNDKIYMLSSFHPNIYRYDLNGNIIDSISADSNSTNNFSVEGSIYAKNGSLYYGSDFHSIGSQNRQLFISKTINGDSVVWKNLANVTPFDDGFTDIVAESNGNVFMLANADKQSVNSFVFVCGFDSSTGDTIWTSKFYGSPGNPSYPCDIEVDNAGNVYVAANLFDNISNSYKTRIVQYNSSNGNENWSLMLDSTFAYWTKLPKICIDTNSHDVYIAYNLFQAAGYPKTCIIKLDSTGSLLWKYWYDSLGIVQAFIYDQMSSLYIGGSLLTKFSLITDIEEQNSNIDGEINVHFIHISNVVSISANSLRGKQYSLSIHDASGRIVYNEQGQTPASFNKSIPFSRRKDGLHLVVLETEKERLTGKVVVLN